MVESRHSGIQALAGTLEDAGSVQGSASTVRGSEWATVGGRRNVGWWWGGV